ncbi:hypothetical protein C1645_794490 [Glomus cerebriforme]|uniref:Alpha/Beta hydrolase protein n=1 Tax=Glomus cerebriforme TaxID=658196 RepID=A0A397S5U5_9GLOM|nr:hypothetical protein C1645_794490 [Glomus cerebriforme]
MNLFKLFSGFIFAFLTISAVTVAQIPLYTVPIDDSTKSYYVTGGNGIKIFVDEKTSWDPQWFDPELYENFHLVRYDFRGWMVNGYSCIFKFYENYPDIKIDGLVSVAELNEKVVPYFLNIVNPQDNFGKVISGLDEIYRSTSFKPLSDELHAFFLGNSVMARDIITDMEHSLYFASLGQNFETIIYKDVGHCILWENIKEFNKDLINFINKI